MFCFGKKWFVEGGFTNDRFISGKRKRTLHHKASGADAYLGGFETTKSEKQSYTTALVKNSYWGIQIGAGFKSKNGYGFRVLANHGGSTFFIGDNFTSNTFHLHLIVPIFRK